MTYAFGNMSVTTWRRLDTATQWKATAYENDLEGTDVFFWTATDADSGGVLGAACHALGLTTELDDTRIPAPV